MMGFSMPTFFSWGNAQNEGMGIPPLPSFLGIPAYLPYDMTKVRHQLEEVEIVSVQKKKNIESKLFPPGRLIFKNMPTSLLRFFRVIPENPKNNTDLILPINNVLYDTDGFYYEFPPDGMNWFKISDGQTFIVTPQYPGMIHVENLTPKLGIERFLPSMWRTANDEQHWTNNPFK